MRVMVAGSSGVVGRALIPKLVAAGHEVIGMSRSASNAAVTQSLGAQPVWADALDRRAVLDVVSLARPEVLVEEFTALPLKLDVRHFDRALAATNVLRTKGTDHLVEAAKKVGVRRLVAQSFAGWVYAREGAAPKTEKDSLDPDPARELREGLQAIRHLETAVTQTPDLEGLALRYGFFYGPIQQTGGLGAFISDVHKRRLPVVGSGAGVWSFVHIDDVVSATLAAIERGTPGVYNVVDDEPAPTSVWLPELARIVGAKPPYHVPEWLARLMVGEAGLILMTQIRGASNQKAKEKLSWRPTWPTWREGFLKEFANGN